MASIFNVLLAEAVLVVKELGLVFILQVWIDAKRLRKDHVELHARLVLILGQLIARHPLLWFIHGSHIKPVQLQVGGAVQRDDRGFVIYLFNLNFARRTLPVAFIIFFSVRFEIAATATAAAIGLEAAQAMSRVVATCLLELLHALEIVDERAKLECRRVIEMMTPEVTVNLLCKYGLLHLLHAIVAAQRLDVEHDVRLVVPHFLERLDKHVLSAADHDNLVE